MKYSCNIINDLLLLYNDDICSEESRNAVEEHLNECNECKEYLGKLKCSINLKPNEKILEQAKVDTLIGVKKKLLRKNVMISVVSVLCAIVILLGGFSFIFNYQIPIQYKEGLLNVDIANDGAIDIVFNYDDYYSSYGITKTIKKDGIEKNVAYIYYSDSIWTKYFTKSHSNTVNQVTIGNNIMVDYGKNAQAVESKKDIAAVYYLIGNYRDFIQESNDEFIKDSQNAILLWEK